MGRLTVIKTLLISQLNHLFISIPNPSTQFLRELNDVLYTFLWNSNVDKVKRNVVTQNYENGGLKMINIQNYIDGLKTTWIRRLITTDDASWKNISFAIMDIDKLLTTGIDILNKTIDNIKNSFWKDVLVAWKKLREKSVCSD